VQRGQVAFLVDGGDVDVAADQIFEDKLGALAADADDALVGDACASQPCAERRRVRLRSRGS
jgi:hypothetical protein